MLKKVFIDGKAGTTGLRIYERLSERSDIELLLLSEEDRKNATKRKELLNSCDVAFLCLPDDAAREAVSMIENPNVLVFDTSTAHRTDPNWAYGFPELSEEFYKKVQTSKRIAVPGCHAGGFIALVYPLIKNGILPSSSNLMCHSVTGYSGGGKQMIAQYESSERSKLLDSPRQYALTQQHKHLKEIVKVCNLDNLPIFMPVVSGFYSGMVMTVPIFAKDLLAGNNINTIKEVYKNNYNSEIVCYNENIADEDGTISSNKLSFNDTMQIGVSGNEDRILLIARYDNLGKGASGAAIECMNIALGINPTTGLSIS